MKLHEKYNINIDNIDELIKYADNNDKYLISLNFLSSTGFMGLNDKAIMTFGMYAQTFNMPLSDPLLGLISNFLDETTMEFTDEHKDRFMERSYELYKLIVSELPDNYIIIYDVNKEDLDF